jgi:tetratricopeptide (TPR) repeat protein
LRGRRAFVGALASVWLGRAVSQSTRGAAAAGVMPPVVDERTALVADAEAALSRGDAAAAAEGFERAGTMRHSADSEMGLVRAAMQLGDYRRALAFCAHVAGEHLDAPGSAVLYAWLLQLGGRRELADRVLREALARAPDDPVIVVAVRALAAPLPVASATLLTPPHRVAPFATGVVGESLPPVEACVVSSGILWPGGRHALVPGRPSSSRLWVRDGLGATREATLDDDGGRDDVATLWRLTTAIEGGDDIVINHRATAGMPVFAIEQAETTASTPAWPWLCAGFLGVSSHDGQTFRLGVDLAAPHAGGPVLDRTGRLVGVALRDAQGRLTMRPASLWTRQAEMVGGATLGQVTSIRPATDLAFDQLYERALRIAVQVIAVP